MSQSFLLMFACCCFKLITLGNDDDAKRWLYVLLNSFNLTPQLFTRICFYLFALSVCFYLYIFALLSPLSLAVSFSFSSLPQTSTNTRPRLYRVFCFLSCGCVGGRRHFFFPHQLDWWWLRLSVGDPSVGVRIREWLDWLCVCAWMYARGCVGE